MHIGLIGGIGPAATVFYYERIVQAYAAAEQPLNLTIGHTSARDLARNVAADRVEEQAAEFKRVAVQLAAAQADVVVITSMGGHFCAHVFAPISPLPMISGPDSVADHLKHEGVRRIGVLGTRVVMQTGLYGVLAELNPVVPPGSELARVNDDYVAVATAGVATRAQRDRLLAAGESLVRDQGAEAVLLGGTDLNVVYSDAAVDFPVIDSAQLHVDAIVGATMAAS